QGFTIYRFVGASWSVVGSVGLNVTTFTDSGLTAGTAYMYVVLAWNAPGQALTPSELTATTLGTWPAAPVLSSATGVSTSQIRLDWVDRSNNESGFRVFRYDGVGWSQIAMVAANQTTYTDDLGLAPATQYAYWLS